MVRYLCWLGHWNFQTQSYHGCFHDLNVLPAVQIYRRYNGFDSSGQNISSNEATMSWVHDDMVFQTHVAGNACKIVVAADVLQLLICNT